MSVNRSGCQCAARTGADGRLHEGHRDGYAGAVPARTGDLHGSAHMADPLSEMEQAQAAGREGVVVTGIDPNSTAAQKGLRQGDVIVEAAGQVVNSRIDLSSAIDSAREAGRKSVLFRVKSADGMKFIALPTKAG